MIYHYCRVSSKDQNLARQIEALSKYKPADRVFTDKESGKDFNRTEYQRMKSIVQSGDEIIVKELDRLGRNKAEIKEELFWMSKHGVIVRILDIPTTAIDFKDQTWVLELVNNLLIEVLGSVAEQERKKIKQRQAEGIAAKRKRPDWEEYGRPEKKIDEQVLSECRLKIKDGAMTIAECCKRLGISRTTWYNRLREAV